MPPRSKRTPFPWIAYPPGWNNRATPTVVSLDGTIVAACGMRTGNRSPDAIARQLANANFIACGGDMLATLMSVEQHLEDYVRITKLSNNGVPTRTLALLRDVKAALKKAEGWEGS